MAIDVRKVTVNVNEKNDDDWSRGKLSDMDDVKISWIDKRGKPVSYGIEATKFLNKLRELNGKPSNWKPAVDENGNLSADVILPDAAWFETNLVKTKGEVTVIDEDLDGSIGGSEKVIINRGSDTFEISGKEFLSLIGDPSNNSISRLGNNFKLPSDLGMLKGVKSYADLESRKGVQKINADPDDPNKFAPHIGFSTEPADDTNFGFAYDGPMYKVDPSDVSAMRFLRGERYVFMKTTSGTYAIKFSDLAPFIDKFFAETKEGLKPETIKECAGEAKKAFLAAQPRY